jgi:hypothetical protein
MEKNDLCFYNKKNLIEVEGEQFISIILKNKLLWELKSGKVRNKWDLNRKALKK